MRKWVVLLVVVVLALLAWVAAGPWLSVRAIRNAVQQQDTAALAEQVDFPALRASLKAQLQDRVVRAAGAGVQSSWLGALGLDVANTIAGSGVELAVTPSGLAALMEGRRVWNKVGDSVAHPDMIDPPSSAACTDVFRGATYRYESLSRFTATVHDADGDPFVFVFARDGLQWKLADIRLPRS